MLDAQYMYIIRQTNKLKKQKMKIFKLNSLYCLQLNLFKNYLQWKCLHFWYKYISQTKFYWAREEIRTPLTLFTLYGSMQKASLEISNIIYQTTSMTIYDGSVTEENTLQSFKEHQVHSPT